jgi:hypothetical protein
MKNKNMTVKLHMFDALDPKDFKDNKEMLNHAHKLVEGAVIGP